MLRLTKLTAGRVSFDYQGTAYTQLHELNRVGEPNYIKEVLLIAAQHCGTAFLVKQGKQSPSGNLNISLSSFLGHSIRGKQLYHFYILELLSL